MNGRPNSAICFSGNAVVGDGAMARRKGVITTRVMMLMGLVLLVGCLMAGRIFLTTQITGLRTRVADLENRKEFLEAGSAKLHQEWNRVANAQIVMERAHRQLGLVVPENPGLVLVCLGTEEDGKSIWGKFKAGVLGADLAKVRLGAGEAVVGAMNGAMVSLEPRGAWAGTYEGGAK